MCSLDDHWVKWKLMLNWNISSRSVSKSSTSWIRRSLNSNQWWIYTKCKYNIQAINSFFTISTQKNHKLSGMNHFVAAIVWLWNKHITDFNSTVYCVTRQRCRFIIIVDFAIALHELYQSTNECFPNDWVDLVISNKPLSRLKCIIYVYS